MTKAELAKYLAQRILDDISDVVEAEMNYLMELDASDTELNDETDRTAHFFLSNLTQEPNQLHWLDVRNLTEDALLELIVTDHA